MSLLTVVVLAWHFAPLQRKDQDWKFSVFMDHVDKGLVSDVTITGNEVKGKTSTGEAFRTFAPLGYDKLVDTLLQKKVDFRVLPDQSPPWVSALVSASPFILLI